MQYEYKKEKAVDSLAFAKSIEIKDLSIAKIEEEKKAQAAQRNVFIVGLFMALLLAIIIYRNSLKRKEANIKLIEQNAEINQQNEEILVQSEEIERQRDFLDKANQELEKLSIVARETDNSVVIANKEGNIEWVNEGFTKLYKYTLEEFKKVNGVSLQASSKNPNITLLINNCVKLFNNIRGKLCY